MSKSLGNSPDLLALIDEWGTDAVRFSVMIASPAGNDLLYDEGMLLQGRNFGNKLWNAMRLVKGWEARVADGATNEGADFAISWMQARLAETATELQGMFDTFRLSEALKIIYSLIWDDFCSWYLEWVKPAQDAPVSAEVYEATIGIFEQLLQLLHPFLPFVTEEIYHQLAERKEGDDLIVRQMPDYKEPNGARLRQGRALQEVITAIRDARTKAGLKPKDPIRILVDTTDRSLYEETGTILRRQTGATETAFTSEAIDGAISIVVQTDKLYLEAEHKIDTGTQREGLQKELTYLQGFLESVEKKLNNERFVQNAKPEVVAVERKKQSDTLSRIKVIEESLALL
jgi:valyl-tRNA synthetase